MGIKPVVISLEGRRVWVCSECGHQQEDTVQCRKCGAPSQAFDEKREPIPEETAVFEALQNILIQGFHVDKGVLVVLPVGFYITDDLIKRKLVKQTSKKVSRKKAVCILSRKVGTQINPLKKEFTRDAQGNAMIVA